MLKLKRAYEEPEKEDGKRILVERLWPRGLSKEKASIDLWLKDISPSTALRVWFSHEPAKWGGFVERYWAELGKNPEPVGELRGLMKKGNVTLIYAAKDVQHNGALALKMFIERS